MLPASATPKMAATKAVDTEAAEAEDAPRPRRETDHDLNMMLVHKLPRGTPPFFCFDAAVSCTFLPTFLLYYVV